MIGITKDRELRLLPFLNRRQQRLQLLNCIQGLEKQEKGEKETKESKKVIEGEPIKTIRPKRAASGEAVFKIFTPFKLVREYLQRQEFQFVEDPHEADILWLYDHFYDWKELPPVAEASRIIYVNQFPEERYRIQFPYQG